MTITDWIQAISMVVLVAVTIVYAWRTHAISKATKAQADASVKMAAEMREQRYNDFLPLLIPDLPSDMRIRMSEPDEVAIESLQTWGRMPVVWRNAGKGVAINSSFEAWGEPLPSGKVYHFSPRGAWPLETGGYKEIDFSTYLNDRTELDQPVNYQPRLEAKYQDIYERQIRTFQEFRIVEEGENRRAFIGDLYFTINGRRLGQET